jgi:hypothetical protein
MDSLTLILVAITNFILAIILGLLCFFIYKFYRKGFNSGASEAPVAPQYPPEIIDRIQDLKAIKKPRSELFCPNHPDEPGEATCAVCDHLYCRSCIRPFKSMQLCKEHFPLLMQHEWVEVITLKTSTQEPAEGVRLYEIKKSLLADSQLPTFVETHYKINVDNDYIETYLVLFCIEEQRSQVEERLATEEFIHHS